LLVHDSLAVTIRRARACQGYVAVALRASNIVLRSSNISLAGLAVFVGSMPTESGAPSMCRR
jgi:hypothetical protein